MKRPLFAALVFAAVVTLAHAQGEAAVAEQYRSWAEQAISEGRWKEALSALERAADYADVSSDISYLLALARSHENSGRREVLEALHRALEADRWTVYSAPQARLLEAENFIALRNFSAAHASLAQAGQNADAAVLALRALRDLPDIAEFRRRSAEALERYPRDSRPARILLEFFHREFAPLEQGRGRNPEENEQALLDLCLQRLPYLIDADPGLAPLAAPFIRDAEAARRLVEAYRGINIPDTSLIPVTLYLGVLAETAAVEELFSPEDSSLDKALILSVYRLLKTDAARNLFKEKLSVYSAFISGDDDRDGYPESHTRYRDGIIQEYFYDGDQDGLAELHIVFDAGGVPQWAEQPDPSDPEKTLVFWEQYPGVLRSEMGGVTYIPRPGEFLWSPVRFITLAADAGFSAFLYPVIDVESVRLTRRSLVSFSVTIRRPSGEFKDAVEWIDLDRGIPKRAVEILRGRPVSVTEFVLGRPAVQWVDLDYDSRMETMRRFRAAEVSPEDDFIDYRAVIEFSESDWDGDGIYETAEQYLPDGSVVYSWDMDRDGIREYSEVKAGNALNDSSKK